MAILQGRDRKLIWRIITSVGGGRPVCHKIPLGILIFLVYISYNLNIYFVNVTMHIIFLLLVYLILDLENIVPKLK